MTLTNLHTTFDAGRSTNRLEGRRSPGVVADGRANAWACVIAIALLAALPAARAADGAASAPSGSGGVVQTVGNAISKAASSAERGIDAAKGGLKKGTDTYADTVHRNAAKADRAIQSKVKGSGVPASAPAATSPAASAP